MNYFTKRKNTKTEETTPIEIEEATPLGTVKQHPDLKNIRGRRRLFLPDFVFGEEVSLGAFDVNNVPQPVISLLSDDMDVLFNTNYGKKVTNARRLIVCACLIKILFRPREGNSSIRNGSFSQNDAREFLERHLTKEAFENIATQEQQSPVN